MSGKKKSIDGQVEHSSEWESWFALRSLLKFTTLPLLLVLLLMLLCLHHTQTVRSLSCVFSILSCFLQLVLLRASSSSSLLEKKGWEEDEDGWTGHSLISSSVENHTQFSTYTFHIILGLGLEHRRGREGELYFLETRNYSSSVERKEERSRERECGRVVEAM